MELKGMTDEWVAHATLDNRPTDVVVCVDTCRFHLHKDVLVKSCDYFKAMFSSHMLEYDQDSVTMKLIEKCPFEILIQGFYSGHLSLTLENVFEVTLAAHILQVSETLFKECCDFMISLIDSKKCFEILHFSHFHNLQAVYDASRRFCVIHFDTLCKEESFFDLTLDQVTNYLSDEFLVAEGEFGKVTAFIEWYNKKGMLELEFEMLQKALCKILHCTNCSIHHCKEIAKRLSTKENFDDLFLSCQDTESMNQDLMMFWARLSDSKGEGLVDVVKLSGVKDGSPAARGVKVDTMTGVVEKPGFDLGSAVCCKGSYVYVCGGGPKFGHMDWIRDIWRYSILEDSSRWNSIGKLSHPLRYHAMVPVATKLYVFGGFGKFRAKNCNLESFDVLTGIWSKHASVPTWEIKPVTTHHHHTMYYISSDWNIYAYDTRLNVWTSLETSSLLYDVSYNPSESFHTSSSHLNKPLSCFVLSSQLYSPNIRFVVLSQGKEFQIRSFAICLKSKSVKSLELECNHNVDLKTHAILGSCLLGKRIVVFLKTVPAKALDWGDILDSDSDDCCEKECTPICIMFISMETGQLSETIQLNNVVRMQSVLAVPFIPNTFKMSPSHI